MSRALGLVFEARAAAFLRTRGLRPVARNFTCKGGELDLVCLDGETVVFVEVRARADDRAGAPEETIGAFKRRRLRHAARVFLCSRGWHDRPCRFDVVAICGERLRHLHDAFGD